jgi:hypothetical protein
MPSFEQQSLGVFSDDSTESISGRSMIRYVAFLRAELDLVPRWHPLHRRYSGQIAQIEHRLGPEGRG